MDSKIVFAFGGPKSRKKYYIKILPWRLERGQRSGVLTV
jgi:hypothetical protein